MNKLFSTLKKDHKEVKELLEKLDSTTERGVQTRKDLLKQLKQSLVPHARAEEQVLYDAMKKSSNSEAQHYGFEGYEEHAVVDQLLEEVEALDPTAMEWTAKMKVIQENLLHHIKEEESETFPSAEKVLKDSNFETMVEDFRALKAQWSSTLPSSKATESPEPMYSNPSS